MSKKKMAKKSKKQHKDFHHLSMLLKYTERSIKGDSSDLDNYFKQSATRLKEKIRGLK